MRNTLAILACLSLLAGCSQSTRPLDSGVASSGTIWKNSLRSAAAENSGTPIPQDARVDVFESLVIVRLSDGSRQVVPLDHVSNLKIK